MTADNREHPSDILPYDNATENAAEETQEENQNFFNEIVDFAVDGKASARKTNIQKKIIFGCMCAAVILIGFFGTLISIASVKGNETENETGDIRVNEIMSSNSYFAALPDGSCYDWIELYNASEKSVNLRGFAISDNPDQPLKWKITDELIIQPNGYVIIYCSGLDKIDESGNFHANFKLSSAGEVVVFSEPDGDLIQQIELPPCNVNNISYGIDERTETNSFVWMAEPSPLLPCNCDTSDMQGNLSSKFNGVVINEYMTKNTYVYYDSDGEYCDWVELYNPTDTDAVMTGCALSDGEKAQWYFPEGVTVPAGGYLLVCCTGKTTASNDELHASFRLGSADSKITLFSASGLPMDSVTIHDLPENVSCGTDPESGEEALFASPTPGAKNSSMPYSLTSAVRSVPASPLVISETLSVSSGKEALNIESRDYIELYNKSSDTVSLLGYGLSDSADEIKFSFPDISIKQGEYLVVWCAEKEDSDNSDECYANFKLDSGGEMIYLTDPQGRLIDSFNTGRQEAGVSRGRISDDLSSWLFFSTPTPGEKNNESSAFITYTQQPVFSSNGGVVDAGYVLKISHSSDSTVVYTLDGSEPNASSLRYDESGITIDSTVVVRAAAISEEAYPSEITTASFFVNVSHSLPIVSVSSDPEGLFSAASGIYSGGHGLLGTEPNYRSDEERPACFEYYVSGKKAVNFNAGIRIFGRGTRASDQKSFAILLREAYGATSVTYPFFGKDSATTFSSLVLRQSGQEWRKSKLRDELCASIIDGRVNCDYMDMTPAVLYINGEYWGLYYIREKLNEDYLVNKYGYEKGKIDIIRDQTMAVSGTYERYDRMIDYVRSHNIASDENYKTLCDMIDVDSFIDFWICQIFFGNDDTANIREHISHKEGSKWRWMVFDLDNACYPYMLRSSVIKFEMLDPAGHGFKNSSSTILARKLFENEEFRERFVSRLCFHLKTTFSPQRTTALLDELCGKICGEIPNQYSRWGAPSVNEWESQIEDIRFFLENREQYVIEDVKNNFYLSDAEFQKIYDAA